MTNTEIKNSEADAINKIKALGAFGGGIITDCLGSGGVCITPSAPVKEAPGKETISPEEQKTNEEGERLLKELEEKGKSKTPLEKGDLIKVLKLMGNGNQRKTAKAIMEVAQDVVKNGPKTLTFMEAYEKIKALNLPKDPLEVLNLNEQKFQEELMKHQTDAEIMMLAKECTQRPDSEERNVTKDLSCEEVVQIHDYMTHLLKDLAGEFGRLPETERHQLSAKACETTAELLVSVGVQRKFNVTSDDVENGLVLHEEQLQQKQEFAQSSQVLTHMMQSLSALSKPRLGLDDFKEYMSTLANQAKQAKAFMKDTYEKYRSKDITFIEAYKLFENFTIESQQKCGSMDSQLLSSFELREHYNAYKKSDPELVTLWDSSGAEVQSIMQMAATGQMAGGPDGGMPALPKAVTKKLGKLKTAEIIDMQELMVDELSKLVKILGEELENAPEGVKFDERLCIPFVQALSSAAVEKRYHINAEEMAMAGFVHAATLSVNERFLQATMSQQHTLMMIPQLVQQHGGGAGAGGDQPCSIM